MNDRIKELAAQAGILCKPREPYDEVNLPGMMCSDNDHYKDNFLAVRAFFDGGLDKFAELIVKECADLFDDDPESGTRYTGVGCRDMIKWYFGVEE